MLRKILGRNKRILLSIVALAAALVLMTENWRGERSYGHLDGAVMGLSAPLLQASFSASRFFGDIGDFLFGWRGLKEENRLMREEITRLRRLAEEQAESEQACLRLADFVEFRRNSGFDTRVASVIGRDATNLFRTVIINKGRIDGIEEGLAVVTPDGVVGKTIKAYSRTATVLLLSDRSSGIDALVQRTRDQGVVRGAGAGGCEMKYLSRQADVAVGDIVVTSGMGGVFPKGVRVGRVTDVRRGGYLLQDVEVKPTASLERLEEVIVILGEGGGK